MAALFERLAGDTARSGGAPVPAENVQALNGRCQPAPHLRLVRLTNEKDWLRRSRHCYDLTAMLEFGYITGHLAVVRDNASRGMVAGRNERKLT